MSSVISAIILLILGPVIWPLFFVFFIPVSPFLLAYNYSFGYPFEKFVVDWIWWPWILYRDHTTLTFWKRKHGGKFLYINHKTKQVRCVRAMEQASNTLRFVAISDTHTKHRHMTIPPGDVLCHLGDILFQDRAKQVDKSLRKYQEFNQWLGEQPHKHKFIIGGNHDGSMQSVGPTVVKSVLSNATYLLDEMAVIPLPAGAKQESVRVYGTPKAPFGGSLNKAFQLDDEAIEEVMNSIPSADVLLTHVGGRGITDRAVARTRPRFHLFGHFHNQHGVWFGKDRIGLVNMFTEAQIADSTNGGSGKEFTTSINCSSVDGSYSTTHLPVVFDLDY